MAKAQRWKMRKCTAFSPQSFHSLRKTGDTEDLDCQLPWLPSVSLWGCNFKLPASKRWWWATSLCPRCYLREHLAHGSCQMHVLENEWWRENKDTFRDREPEPSNQSRHSPPAGDEYRGTASNTVQCCAPSGAASAALFISWITMIFSPKSFPYYSLRKIPGRMKINPTSQLED